MALGKGPLGLRFTPNGSKSDSLLLNGKDADECALSVIYQEICGALYPEPMQSKISHPTIRQCYNTKHLCYSIALLNFAIGRLIH